MRLLVLILTCLAGCASVEGQGEIPPPPINATGAMVLRHPCAPSVMITEHLIKLREQPVLQLVGGKGMSSAMFEVWHDKDMDDWSIIVTTTEGITCMLGGGNGVIPIDWFIESGLVN